MKSSLNGFFQSHPKSPKEYVKTNVLYVHCTVYILHILDLARALVFNAAHSTLHKIAFRMNGR